MVKTEISENIFTVGLCDDEGYVHDMLDEMLSGYSKDRKIKLEIIHFYSAKEVLDMKKEIDALLLDIEMPNMDGIELGRELLKRKINYKIVMLTANENRYKEAFEIQAFRFVPKPVNKTELYAALDDVKDQLVAQKRIHVFRDTIAYDIAQTSILYIEAYRSGTRVYTQNLDYRSEKSITAWSEELDEHLFFRCHRSYIVNLSKIEEIEKNVIRLSSKDKIMVSRRLYTSLLRAYAIYDAQYR